MVPPNATRDDTNHKIEFNHVPFGLVGLQAITVNVTAGNPIVSVDIQDGNKADPSPIFKSVDESGKSGCGTELQNLKDPSKAPAITCLS